MAQAANGNIVRINYTGKLADGTVFDTSETEGREPLGFRLGENQVLPKLEAEIVGMSVGDKKTVAIEANDAYGPHQEQAIQRVERSEIPDGGHHAESLQLLGCENKRPHAPVYNG